MGSKCLKSYIWNSIHIETAAVALQVTAAASCYKGLYQSAHIISLNRRGWKHGQYVDAVLVFLFASKLLSPEIDLF